MSDAVIEVRAASVRFSGREIWSDVSFELAPGEFLAVLGPNGSGKTTLLRVLLGLERLTEGEVLVAGHPPRRGSREIGYIPQQRAFPPNLALRGRDLVRLGLDGHRFGLGSRPRATERALSDALESVEALGFADAPVGSLSGGEQQRLRVAQALIARPQVLLCDEPLLSLDPAHQGSVTALIDRSRRATGAGVVFVTHEVNPVLSYVDRILYLVNRRFVLGHPDEVLTSAALSELYGTEIEVVRTRERVIVLGAEHDEDAAAGEAHHHLEEASGARRGWFS